MHPSVRGMAAGEMDAALGLVLLMLRDPALDKRLAAKLALCLLQP